MQADTYLWVMIGLGSIMSFAIGSNETDALAATYSSGALSMMACVSYSRPNASTAYQWSYIRIHWRLLLLQASEHDNFTINHPWAVRSDA